MRHYRLQPRPCAVCEAEKDEFLSELHDFERLTCAADPERGPGHRPATGSEWWAWILGIEPTPQQGHTPNPDD